MNLIGNGAKYMRRINWSREFEEFLIRNDLYSQVMTALFTRNITFKDYTRGRSYENYAYDLFGLIAPELTEWDTYWKLVDLWENVCYIIIENESI